MSSYDGYYCEYSLRFEVDLVTLAVSTIDIISDTKSVELEILQLTESNKSTKNTRYTCSTHYHSGSNLKDTFGEVGVSHST